MKIRHAGETHPDIASLYSPLCDKSQRGELKNKKINTKIGFNPSLHKV